MKFVYEINILYINISRSILTFGTNIFSVRNFTFKYSPSLRYAPLKINLSYFSLLCFTSFQDKNIGIEEVKAIFR